MSGSALRNRLRAERALIEIATEQRAQVLVDQVMGHPFVEALPPGSWVACFANYGDEPPTRPLLQALCDRGFEVCVPAVHGKNLHWHDITGEVDDPRAWSRDALGIPIPTTPTIATTAHELLALGLRLVITPSLGLERNGARIGQGGGYYDRLFAELPRHADGGPFRMGVTHLGGLLPDGTIEMRPHDERVDAALEA